MRFATYVSAIGVPTWGAEQGDDLIDLGPSGANLAPDLRSAVAAGLLSGLLPEQVSGPRTATADAVFLPVILDPAKILCIGVNYQTHQKETGREAPPAPTVFTRFADSQMGHEAPALRPSTTTQFDYEGELAIVIGRPAFRVAEEEAFDVVAGYAAYNDFSVRDWQRAATQWIPGKNFRSTGSFGPFFVPASDVPDVSSLHLETRVNGEVRQAASLSDLVFDIPRLVSYVTGFTALAAGDVIVTGTPGGVGLFMDPQGLLDHGDVVEVDITGLGVLRNTVVQER